MQVAVRCPVEHARDLLPDADLLAGRYEGVGEVTVLRVDRGSGDAERRAFARVEVVADHDHPSGVVEVRRKHDGAGADRTPGRQRNTIECTCNG